MSQPPLLSITADGPKWVKYTESPKYGYITGEVNLTCVVSADPPASIRWYAGQDKQQLAEPLASKVISEENRSTLRVSPSDFLFPGEDIINVK